MKRYIAPLTVVSPYAFFGGFIIGLVLLSLAGRLVSQHSNLSGFNRLHRYVNPEGLYYPTASQLRETARVAARDGQILVIVGGSSVMQGVGQGATELWSDHLREELGEPFAVVNLAMAGGAATEFGAVAAQALYREGYKVIYVTDMAPGPMVEPDGLLYKYTFWDAYYKGLLDDDAVRMQRIEENGQGAAADALTERRIRGMLEGVFYDTDLWNWFGYTVMFTTPNMFVRLPAAYFTTPRRLMEDPAPVAFQVLPFEQRYPPAGLDTAMSIVKGGLGLVCKQADGDRWEPDSASPSWGEFDITATAAFPDGFRQRVVPLLLGESPHYLAKLRDDEQACYRNIRPETAVRLSAVGYRPMVSGASYTEDDYNDRVHLRPSGGQKLAADVAPHLRRLARGSSDIWSRTPWQRLGLPRGS